MPEEWTVKDASEKKRKAEENHNRGPGRPRRAERSTGEENNNLRLVEGGRGGGGGGEEDLEESGGEESQESGSEEALTYCISPGNPAAYQIIVADAVSVNFSGRCKFLQI